MRKGFGAWANRMRGNRRSRRSRRSRLRVVVLHGVVAQLVSTMNQEPLSSTFSFGCDCSPVQGEARSGHELLGLLEGDRGGDVAVHELVGVGLGGVRPGDRGGDPVFDLLHGDSGLTFLMRVGSGEWSASGWPCPSGCGAKPKAMRSSFVMSSGRILWAPGRGGPASPPAEPWAGEPESGRLLRST